MNLGSKICGVGLWLTVFGTWTTPNIFQQAKQAQGMHRIVQSYVSIYVN